MTREHHTVTRRTLLRRLLQSGVAASLVNASVTTIGPPEGTGFTRVRRVEIESFDGTTLVGSVYEPTDRSTTRGCGEASHPAILMTHGWGDDRMGEWQVRTAERYARNGYVVLVYDSRGFGASDGEVGFDGPNEVADVSALISWLGRRPTVRTSEPIDDRPNPRIGMDGLSYAGGLQLNAASVDSRLDVMVPRWAWNDLVTSFAPNGVVKKGWATLLYLTGVAGAHGISSAGLSLEFENIVHGLAPQFHDTCLSALIDGRLSDDARAYLTDRSPRGTFDRIETPALFISGWADTLFTPNEALQNYRRLRKRGIETRLILFDGGHILGTRGGPDLTTQRIIDTSTRAWVNAHLRGNTPAPLPPILYYQKRTDSWVSLDRFPDPDRFPAAGANDALTFSLGSAALGPRSLLINSVVPTSMSHLGANVDLARGMTAVSFDFPIDESFELLGTPVLDIAVASLSGKANLFAKLSRIRDGQERQLYSQVTPFTIGGTDHTNDRERPPRVPDRDHRWDTAIEPSPQRKRIELVTTQRQFDTADALRLTLATTDAGFFTSPASIGAYIYHSEAIPSTLTLPIR